MLKNLLNPYPHKRLVIFFTLLIGIFFSLPLLISTLLPTTNAQNEKRNLNSITSNALIGACAIYPPDNAWNTDISAYPVDPHSDNYISYINGASNPGLHPDFGTVYNGLPIGIPFNIVSGSQPKVNVSFDYADESDPGPYPIPANPKVEGLPDGTAVGASNCTGDCHMLMLDQDNCILYELYSVSRDTGGNWHAGSGAIFNLKTNDSRPEGFTSADAAGLAILPGLVTYDETASGVINHAIRFTVSKTQKAYLHPATHYASSTTDPNAPPMGLRFRLKANFDISGFDPQIQVILTAMKKYGLIIADNGSNWYISGAPDSRWNDTLLHTLGQVKGSDFEAVYTGNPITNPDTSYLPNISGFSPSSGVVNDDILISGENLMGTTSVLFNGTSTTFQLIGTTLLSAKVPAGTTTGQISLVTGTGTAASTSSFIVSTGGGNNNPPTISSFTPVSGTPNTMVTITGTNFTGSNSVQFNGTAASFTVVSATSIKATVPVGATSGKISVTNGSNTATSSSNFSVVAGITSFSPTSGPISTVVTITGAGFTGASGVKFNSTSATNFTVNSDSQITATVPSNATTGKISITSASKTVLTSATNFNVTAGITSFTPISATTGASVTIMGSGFIGATSVKFNGVTATFTVQSATAIKAIIPTNAVSGLITVTTPAGTATSINSFTVLPKITGFTPTNGSVNTIVTINGSGFTNSATVLFNGVSSSKVTFVSSTSIKATVPTGAKTGKVKVITSAGTATSIANFTVR